MVFNNINFSTLTNLKKSYNGPKSYGIRNGPKNFEPSLTCALCSWALWALSFIHGLLAPSGVFQKFPMYLYKHSILQVIGYNIINSKLSYINFSLIIVFGFNTTVKNTQMCWLFVILSPSINPYWNECIIHLIDTCVLFVILSPCICSSKVYGMCLCICICMIVLSIW